MVSTALALAFVSAFALVLGLGIGIAAEPNACDHPHGGGLI
ncbi:hypothetical protein ACFZ8E_22630 [Methylobacterium sp. HMF5984]|jgi:hypothetical protein|nr:MULTISPECIES: hypothetical protein [unclassified Methylobacterium]